MKLHKILLVLSIPLFLIPLFPYRDYYERPWTVKDYISKYSFEYQVPEKTVLRVLQGESRLECDPKGHNDGGLAHGVAQFHKPTFDSFSEEMGQKLDYYSCHDQIKLFVWALSEGYGGHWTVYKNLKNRGII